jgi:hypothetical protein
MTILDPGGLVVATVSAVPPVQWSEETRMMEHSLPNGVPSAEAVDAEAALDRIIQQIQSIREQMKADDAEIARLKADTAALKAETRAILSSLPTAA